ncbi:PAS domain-containing protein [Roseovarius sp. LXJ103]|nr:PAS domain-containing protein [Roseovarius carneus]PWE37191.1 PAS domain-containing protein [Pelagicola sp. LXJ1103]
MRILGGRGASEQAALLDFQSYWTRMRRGGDVPRRSDIDPREIEPLLPNAFIIERIAPGLARLRIAGSHLSDLMGMEVRGMPISAFLTPGDRDALAQHMVRLFDEPAIVRLTLSSASGSGAPALDGTLIMLPLRSDLGDISRALGCLVSSGPSGRAPRRFSITHTKLTSINVSLPSVVAASTPEPLQTGFADPAASFEGVSGTTPAKSGERSYLRLIKSD